MAEPQERGPFILDLDVTSGGHLFFLQENSLNGAWVGLGERGAGGEGGFKGGERVWRDRTARCQGLTQRVTPSLSVLTL